MGLYHCALVVAAVILAIASPAAAAKELKLTTLGALTPALENSTPTKRLLRAYTTNEEDGEDGERGISAKIPGLEKISNALKSSRTSKAKELQGLLKADESIANAFKTLKLSTMPIGKNDFIETELVVKLFTSTNFKVWSKYAKKTNREDPYGAMVTALANVFGDKDLAIMILLGKGQWSSMGVAKKLEKSLFRSWLVQGKQPSDLLEKVFHVDRYWLQAYPRVKDIWGAYSTYVTKTVMNH
ncbi:hypothetical protein PF005_g14738 [Phytophthora fragariae]|uniref:RxLR effector protein n=1 Tax=Phytophthora fragariae TaxID=53985 RepID=A0A6A3VIA2_9STRA|nr:hypothetical protein PF003_g17467 [Phytophthora fragariae]KAE8919066.1 hypothetical protein PF009_g30620 [Phytophthora fragariae]KAE8962237.1 hypothetical protein PF011_g29461 [Phytophthora fragariae]KAE9061174.1 hypothetical protein PF010_g29916 [Phytophthora fragariae]KAE9061689.1 hypothetical protein PF007_g30168 [Phytophthora fragariae]